MICSVLSTIFELLLIVITIFGMFSGKMANIFYGLPFLLLFLVLLLLIRKVVFFKKNAVIYNFRKIYKSDIIKMQLVIPHRPRLGFSYFLRVFTKTKEYNLYIGWFSHLIIYRIKELCQKHCIKFEIKDI